MAPSSHGHSSCFHLHNIDTVPGLPRAAFLFSNVAVNFKYLLSILLRDWDDKQRLQAKSFCLLISLYLLDALGFLMSVASGC
jgi:hypothetical protein